MLTPTCLNAFMPHKKACRRIFKDRTIIGFPLSCLMYYSNGNLPSFVLHIPRITFTPFLTLLIAESTNNKPAVDIGKDRVLWQWLGKNVRKLSGSLQIDMVR